MKSFGIISLATLVAIAITVLCTGAIVNTQLQPVKTRLDSIENNSMPTKKLADLHGLLGAYQVTLSQDSVYIWDCDRYIGGFALDYDADPLSTMILEDNR